MGYHVTRVQQRAFSMHCTIYGPAELPTTVSGSKLVEGRDALLAPAVEGVPCRSHSTSDADQPVVGLGQANVDQMDTTDRLRLPSKLWRDDDPTKKLIEPGDGWFINILDGFGAATGCWYAVQGGPQGNHHRAHTCQYLVKRTHKPPLAT